MGPLLFILYINDLPDVVESFVKIFADDTKFFREIESIEDHDSLQEDANKVFAWSEEWQLPFNVEKCKVMHYGGNNQDYSYSMNNTSLENIREEKDLGVIFDKNLKVLKSHNQNDIKSQHKIGYYKAKF